MLFIPIQITEPQEDAVGSITPPRKEAAVEPDRQMQCCGQGTGWKPHSRAPAIP